MEQTVKYKTETQEFVGRCKELFQIFIEEKITLDEMQREIKEMSNRQLVIPACRESLPSFPQSVSGNPEGK